MDFAEQVRAAIEALREQDDEEMIVLMLRPARKQCARQ
jgi:hypothetical protein